MQWVKIEGDGRNNLDFHLAFYLGELANSFPNAEFVILSKDKGFDALLKHANQRNIRCRRIDTCDEAMNKAPAPQDPQFKRAFELLSKIEKKSRPRKRKTLVQYVASIFQKKLTTAENERIVEWLFSNNHVSEAGNALTYQF